MCSGTIGSLLGLTLLGDAIGLTVGTGGREGQAIGGGFGLVAVGGLDFTGGDLTRIGDCRARLRRQFSPVHGKFFDLLRHDLRGHLGINRGDLFAGRQFQHSAGAQTVDVTARKSIGVGLLQSQQTLGHALCGVKVTDHDMAGGVTGLHPGFAPGLTQAKPPMIRIQGLT